MKRTALIITALIAALLVVPQGDSASAATGKRNWLARDCNQSGIVRDCVYEAIDYDTLAKHRHLVFRDHKGKKHTVTNRSWLWTVAKDHSHKCATKGDPTGCYFTDSIMGKSVILPTGGIIAITYLPKKKH